MMTLYLEDCTVISHEKINDKDYILTLQTEKIAREAEAGQFVQLKVSDTIDPVLRRPISVHTVDREKGHLKLYYQVLGKGTEILKRTRTGDILSVLGPLGKGFDLSLKNSRALLVGGGLGQAPLLLLAEELGKNNNEVFLALGTRDELSLKNAVCFDNVCREVKVATEDGSIGYKGYITNNLPDIIESFKPEIIYACGPNIMMNKIKEIALKYNVKCQVSLETRMACGIGVCLGCTVVPTEDGKPYLKACVDGPVFWAQEVVLDDWI